MKKLEKLKAKTIKNRQLNSVYGGLMAPDATVTFYDTHCSDSGNGASDCEDGTKDKDK